MFVFSELETSQEQTNTQLKDERQLRKTYEGQLSSVREELAEWRSKAELLEKVDKHDIIYLFVYYFMLFISPGYLRHKITSELCA